MPSLNLDLNYFDNIKTIRLKGRLGEGAELLPIKLWIHCGKHHPANGVLNNYTDDEIEKICGWEGKQGAMIRAMEELNFLQKTSGGWQVNDWLVHEGHLAAYEKRARNAANARWGHATSNASSIPQGQDKQCPCSTSSTSSAVHAVHDPKQCSKHKPYEIPDPAKDPVRALVVYFKVLKGVDYEDREWDAKWMHVYSPLAKTLLDRAGDYNLAYGCLEHYGMRWMAKGYTDWKLDGIIARLAEWKAAQKGAKHGVSNRSRFFDALERQRESRKNSGLRTTADAVSRIVRDATDRAPGKTGPPNGRPNGVHEKPMESLLERHPD